MILTLEIPGGRACPLSGIQINDSAAHLPALEDLFNLHVEIVQTYGGGDGRQTAEFPFSGQMAPHGPAGVHFGRGRIDTD